MAKFYWRLFCLLLLVGGISSIVIYYTVDIHTLRHLNTFQPWSLLGALVFLAIGLYFDGTRLLHLVRISGEQITMSEAVQVVFGNYFLALVTPGATGGAVAQVMFLRRAGVPIGKATVIVVVRTILSILFLLLCMPIVFFFDSNLLPGISERVLVMLSIGLLVAIFAGIRLFQTSVPGYLVVVLTKRLRHSYRRRIFTIYRDIRGAVFILSSSPRKILQVFFESALSLLALYSMVPILFMGLDAAVSWGHVLGRMIFLNIFLYFAPTPGGSGIAEGGFVLLFKELLPSGTVGIAAVGWRIIAEYLPFCVGLYFMIKVFGADFLMNKLDKH